jgi:ribosomal protein S21
MTFQVEITPIASNEIEQAYRWFRGLMNEIATLQEKPRRYRTLL